ncbi:MAG: 3-hydroxyacyl-[acyl-carrier-protein] dehydratase FabZ [Rhodospirillaceae bacterium]|nr:3-hydroxyacyl-[acyl-carrier-protein] dehydratase FabZ [Rhodospirillaceae bacterium]|tara:strand:- start:2487 stop:2975 length:489 start_codon:yes stop_codon:yes gene_type:complete
MNDEIVDTGQQEAGHTVDVVGIERVMDMIPHRYPFLMIDRVVDVVRDKSAIGIKNVSINEPQFQGHFPRHPVMPGVLIIEAMAQSAAVLVVETLGKEFEGKLVYFMGVDKARFRKPVTPGDVMKVHVHKEHQRGPVWKFGAVVKVDGTTVAEANYSAMILDN